MDAYGVYAQADEVVLAMSTDGTVIRLSHYCLIKHMDRAIDECLAVLDTVPGSSSRDAIEWDMADELAMSAYIDIVRDGGWQVVAKAKVDGIANVTEMYRPTMSSELLAQLVRVMTEHINGSEERQ